MRRTIVLNLPPQLVFPGEAYSSISPSLSYYDRKWRSKLRRHSDKSIGVIYDRNMFIKDATAYLSAASLTKKKITIF